MSGGGAGGKGAAAPVPAASRKLGIVTREDVEICAEAARICGLDPNEAVSVLLFEDDTAPRTQVSGPATTSINSSQNQNVPRSMCSSGEYQQSKQVAEQNSNKEQEASSEKEKEDTKRTLWVASASEVNRAVLAAVQEIRPRTVFVEWQLDSGSSLHITGKEEILHGLHLADVIMGTVANGQEMRSDACGRVSGDVNLCGVRLWSGRRRLRSTSWSCSSAIRRNPSSLDSL